MTVLRRTAALTLVGAACVGVGVGVSGQARASAAGPVVRTDKGLVRGVVQGSSLVFDGIPYAAPPVGKRRWAAPQPAAGWHGVRDATKPGSECPQTAGLLGDPPGLNEDCLYLNVTEPRHPGRGKLPVMVWIHGGGYYSGSGSLYGARRLAEQGHVVVVTLNYRLGAFGFLALPGQGGASGNYGLQDQQAALGWVRRNAAGFGGDARNVTIVGESAGAVSVCTHLASPGSKGLFARAVVQSGPCALTPGKWPYPDGVWVPRPRTVADKAGLAMAHKLGCDGGDLSCLRGKSPAAVLDASDGGQGFGPVYGGGGVLPLSPEQAIASGHYAKVPVIQGMTRDEHRTFQAAIDEFTGHPATEADYTQQVRDLFGPKNAARILARYPTRQYGTPSLALATVLTDYTWATSALRTDRLLQSRTPVYAYEFADRQAPWATSAQAPVFPTGAFHASELQYLFDDEQFTRPLSPAQRRLSNTMIAYWSRFARTGNPNGAGLPAWKPFTSRAERIQSLAPTGIKPAAFDAEHQLAFWRSLGLG